jgi:transcriptional regulator with XRE-family HTH domain
LELRKKVVSKIEELGVKESARFFGVSAGTISNWSTGKTDPSLSALELVLALDGEDDWARADAKARIPREQEAEPELFQWEGKDAIILLPVYRTFNADTHFTLFANYAKYGPEKLGMIMQKRTLIHESRNILVHKALKTDARWFLMCDDDMILPCGNAALYNEHYGAGVSQESASFNAISRLMSHPEDKRIVGALYFGRTSRGKAQCCSAFADDSECEKIRLGKYKGLKPEDWVACGFMRIHRNVFEEMAKAIDGGMWPELAPVGKDGWYGFFNPMRVRMGEDVSFGRRAKELGIQSYLDASLILLHNGETNFGPRNTKA